MLVIEAWPDENAIGLPGYAAWVAINHEIRAFGDTMGDAIAGVEREIRRHNASDNPDVILTTDPNQHRVERIRRPVDSPYSGEGLRRYREQLEHRQGT